jgi:hypothetical protein
VIGIDLSERTWRVREGEHYRFWLEPPLDEDDALSALLADFDAQYPRLSALLDIAPLPRSLEPSVRLLREPWPPPAAFRRCSDSATSSEPARWACGEVTADGILFGQTGFRWDELAGQLMHEAVHLAWNGDVGEAPSLLNEGVATWFEFRLAARPRHDDLAVAWDAVFAAGEERLADLARNNGFAAAYRRGLPAYEVGAALVGFLIDTVGLPAVKTLFRESYADDEHLPERIEAVLGQSLDAATCDISTWLRRPGPPR